MCDSAIKQKQPSLLMLNVLWRRACIMSITQFFVEKAVKEGEGCLFMVIGLTESIEQFPSSNVPQARPIDAQRFGFHKICP